jgi:hypothetical protein
MADVVERVGIEVRACMSVYERVRYCLYVACTKIGWELGFA